MTILKKGDYLLCKRDYYDHNKVNRYSSGKKYKVESVNDYNGFKSISIINDFNMIDNAVYLSKGDFNGGGYFLYIWDYFWVLDEYRELKIDSLLD